MVDKSKLKKIKSKEYYVDNKLFLKEITEYVTIYNDSLQDKPKINDYLGECFLNIAKKLSNKPNFVNYSFKEEMISDGVENALQYMHNFNPLKSENPFAYFTQIIMFAFLRRIMKEKRQLYVKFRLTEDAFLHEEPYNKKYINDKSDENMRNFIQKFEESIDKKRKP